MQQFNLTDTPTGRKFSFMGRVISDAYDKKDKAGIIVYESEDGRIFETNIFSGESCINDFDDFTEFKTINLWYGDDDIIKASGEDKVDNYRMFLRFMVLLVKSNDQRMRKTFEEYQNDFEHAFNYLKSRS